MTHTNQLRIIGGKHRGRRLRFPEVRGLRPTASRLRETLFNWLQGEVEGRHCLDLFCGSGALGLEALSRGAQQVCFVDRATAVSRQIRDNLAQLNEQHRACVYRADVLNWLNRPAEQRFDIVFMDPPFASDLIEQACQLLDRHGWLEANAWIYLEQDAKRNWPPHPNTWHLYRQTKAGQAACRLLQACYNNSFSVRL